MAQEKTSTWAPKHPAGSELKGGGMRGGPKRWTGRGPAPARHIPWPEVFKHHLSVVEGHQKMIDMIRKHTVEGTSNYQTISQMLDRAHQMLADTKQASRDFVVPRDNFETVPIGSSSASMYPGYSPADIAYGEASQEYGNTIGKNKGPMANHQSDGPQQDISKTKTTNYKPAKFVRAPGTGENAVPLAKREQGSSGSKPERLADPPASTTAPVSAEANEYFVVDEFPTRSNGEGASGKHAQDDHTAEHKPSKKAKTAHGSEPSTSNPVVEHEDISEEVSQRMKEKEEKRKAKKEKKRKRESQDATPVDAATPAENGTKDEEQVSVKPSKKKSKKSEAKVEGQSTESDSKKRSVDGVDEGEKKKKKKKKQKE